MLIYPTVITSRLKESKEFYTRYFDFEVMFENDWYLHLVSPSGFRLAFLLPNHPSQPPFFHTAYNGKGIIYNLEVGDVEAEYNRLKSQNVVILSEVKTEEWGQKHFVVEDPNGMKIDVYQGIEPAEEYRV